MQVRPIRLGWLPAKSKQLNENLRGNSMNALVRARVLRCAVIASLSWTTVSATHAAGYDAHEFQVLLQRAALKQHARVQINLDIDVPLRSVDVPKKRTAGRATA